MCVAGIANLLSDHDSGQPKSLVTRGLGGTQAKVDRFKIRVNQRTDSLSALGHDLSLDERRT